MDTRWIQLSHSRVNISGANLLVLRPFPTPSVESSPDVEFRQMMMYTHITQARLRRLLQLRSLSSFCLLLSCAFPFGNYPCNDVGHVLLSRPKEAQSACRRDWRVTIIFVLLCHCTEFLGNRQRPTSSSYLISSLYCSGIWLDV